jgi:hypothetical protein
LALGLSLLSACTPRLALTTRTAAKVSLGPARTLAVLTHDTRLGEVMRERLKHDLSPDTHFTLVRMCGQRSCEPVDAFVRLYERTVRAVVGQNGPAMEVIVEADVVLPDGRVLRERQERRRTNLIGGDAPQVVAERLASDIAGEVAWELFHPAAQEWLVFDDGAAFKLGVSQALDGPLGDARRTFEAMIDANPQTAGAWFNLALVLEAQRDPAAARVKYEKALTLTNKQEYREAFAAFERREQQRAALVQPH